MIYRPAFSEVAIDLATLESDRRPPRGTRRRRNAIQETTDYFSRSYLDYDPGILLVSTTDLGTADGNGSTVGA